MQEKASRLRRFRGLRRGRMEAQLTLPDGRRLIVLVASQAEVEAGLGLEQPYAVVSMLDPESSGLQVADDPRCRGVLRLRYHDTRRRYDDPVLPDGLQPLTLDQARAICAFVREHLPAIECLVVHCHHGMSRSPAVAAALTACLGGDDAVWRRKKVPNLVVLELIRVAWSGG